MHEKKNTYEVQAAVDYIRAQKGHKSFLPDYDITNGLTAWRFGDLAISKGYDNAVWYAELIRDRVPGIPPDCNLLTTFSAFRAAEAQIINKPYFTH
jgi:hypothetical protein